MRIRVSLLSLSIIMASIPAYAQDYRAYPAVKRPTSNHYYAPPTNRKSSEKVWVKEEFIKELTQPKNKHSRDQIDDWGEDKSYRESTFMDPRMVRRDSWDSDNPNDYGSAPNIGYEDGNPTNHMPQDPIKRRIQMQEERAQRQAEEYRRNYQRRQKVNDNVRVGVFEDRPRWQHNAFSEDIVRRGQDRISPFSSPANDRSMQQRNRVDPRISPFTNDRQHFKDFDDRDPEATRVNTFSRAAEPIMPGDDPYWRDLRQHREYLKNEENDRPYVGKHAGPTRISPFRSPPRSSTRKREYYGDRFEDQPRPLITRPFN